MNRRPRHPLRVIESRRMTLVAATPELIEADLAGCDAFSQALGAHVPDNWPPQLYGSTAMRVAAEQLLDPAEHGWSVWYLLSKKHDPPTVLGICGFKGMPGPEGSVEIAYSVLQQFRVQGYATEAVARLIAWAFSHQNVVAVTAETMPHLKQSIRVMEKNGLSFAGPGSEHGVVKYALGKASG
ncbi:MAG: GNAT family N-acetyltransferase [Xanthomonadales bacterium]|jgi:RimJ/RimL family protein N-acetyltransferase|nr:GNAT family N-acetyltransferase [Xanthomonadales bacterium]MDH3924376.1 GNAT family N-acetyltransferase [Xanthomonadales bacterium]MDH3939977.1 GNAT family N-acetyltransferase [Xanthomonadales bacterium]MDH4002638.1 GNAT family N-acetyltransferase [Xanthomonadales bacterium]